MKKDLIELIDSQKEIEKMFHSFDGGMGTSFVRISDVHEFQSWIQKIKLELQEIYDRTHELSQLQGGAFEIKKKPLIFISHSSKKVVITLCYSVENWYIIGTWRVNG